MGKNSKNQPSVVCVLLWLNTYASRKTQRARYATGAPKISLSSESRAKLVKNTGTRVRFGGHAIQHWIVTSAVTVSSSPSGCSDLEMKKLTRNICTSMNEGLLAYLLFLKINNYRTFIFQDWYILFAGWKIRKPTPKFFQWKINNKNCRCVSFIQGKRVIDKYQNEVTDESAANV